MKKCILSFMFLLAFFASKAQTPLYDESADAQQQIEKALATARQQDRFVICQVGGNWCPWCIRFSDFIQKDSAIRHIIEEHFVYIHVNYSKNNKNPEAMRRLGNPARFGFPVLVILDADGNVIHIQNSAYLEEGKGYHREKVYEFLSQWTPQAVRTLK